MRIRKEHVSKAEERFLVATTLSPYWPWFLAYRDSAAVDGFVSKFGTLNAITKFTLKRNVLLIHILRGTRQQSRRNVSLRNYTMSLLAMVSSLQGLCSG
mmetsp:Transcript_5816/g.14516  ORF Transcript_5816/g.14516 Transcript_5816/m.14516 type:complete len:99 (+) Transcript_5816:92-388(+)